MFALLFALLPRLTQVAATNPCSKSFLGLETWFHYLPASVFDLKDPKSPTYCAITGDGFNVIGANSSFLLIGLAILDDLIRIAGLVAVGYVIYGGIQYVTSQGSPDATSKAQQTIINALIGVAVAILAASIVGFIGSKLG
jgi:hypothetical protein